MYCLTFICVFALTAQLLTARSFFSRGSSKTFNHDYTSRSQLNNLFNSRVHTAERVERPFMGRIPHSGVRVTLEDGSSWLVHKGSGYGRSSQTVVTDARHMSDRWKVTDTRDFGGSKTVADMVKSGGATYNVLTDNCHHASKRMMKD